MRHLNVVCRPEMAENQPKCILEAAQIYQSIKAELTH